MEIWKRGCVLAERTHEAFEGSREFEYKSQMVRASLSIPSNTAEGAYRRSPADFCRFLDYAKGSAGELFTQATVADARGIISPQAHDFISAESHELSAMIESFIQRLSQQ